MDNLESLLQIKRMLKVNAYKIVLASVWLIIGLGMYALLMSGCANRGVIHGGPRDTVPPVLIVERSTPNRQVHFRPQEIILYFDEWIQLHNPTKEIFITPPLEGRYDVKAHGKRVVMRFSEETQWQDRTTYLIHFGRAIRDLHEGNPADSILYVFSTGAHIDSLQLYGRIVDVETNAPVEGSTVLLYAVRKDSPAVRDLPDYMAFSDRNGRFHFQYLRDDSFHLLAVVDNNRNYRVDFEIERHGFYPHPVASSKPPDSLEVVLFPPPQSPRVLRTMKTNTALKVELSTPPERVSIQLAPPTFSFRYAVIQDTLYIIWHADAGQELERVYLRFADQQWDTIELGEVRRTFQWPREVRLIGSETILTEAEKGWLLAFNQPVSWDTARIDLLEDGRAISSDKWTLEQDSASWRWKIHCPWQHTRRYQCIVSPGAWQGPSGRANPDTVEVILPTVDARELGSYIIRMHFNKDRDTSARAGIVRLIRDEDIAREMCYSTRDSVWQVEWKYLSPGNYHFIHIEDIDADCLWDTGDWQRRVQPERIERHSLPPLRANWETVIDIYIAERRDKE